MTTSYDVFCAGELLVDFIGREDETSLADTRTFERFRGGSPANLAANLSGLGLRTGLAASVGEDALGDFAVDELRRRGVDVSNITRRDAPTTLAVINRSSSTAEFVLQRGADRDLDRAAIDRGAAATRLFHTTAFALTCPTGAAAVQGASTAVSAGADVSLDMNWAPGVGAAQEEAIALIQAYCSLGALVKASADDLERLLGRTSPNDAMQTVLSWGASLVVLTLGREGSTARHRDGRTGRRPVEAVDVVDATGAGDAYWAGFLWRWLADAELSDCMEVGTGLAERKLGKVGPISHQELGTFAQSHQK